ncbi:DNA-binding bromodomain-containing protein [Abeliophyllum distichum]|uniref:DNA-binding bromodomain-containing protein n=1 Tax=Abeliophyllum distichum TaxID=126358 RepID=A0ABD1QKM2_9LAMI
MTEKMGQIVKRKKKGRPANADPQSRQARQPERDLRRSIRNRNVKYALDLDDYFDDEEFFEDVDENQQRREKQLNLLLKDGFETVPQASRTQRVSDAPATSASSSSDGDNPSRKRKIDRRCEEEIEEEDCVKDDDNYDDEEVEVKERKLEPKAEGSPTGTPSEAPTGFPLPDKKALELILDKLQKKDIYGVYAEPVDPEELPDYHDVIEHPMDFATVRNKLGNGSYANLEQFESDVFLICSNAMQYNTPDTVYYKQARTIQEMAKRKFEKIRIKIERSGKELKPEQKMKTGFILKKQINRSASRTVQEHVSSDFSSGATPATAGDLQNVSSVPQTGGLERPGIIDGLVEGISSLNDNNIDKEEESLSGKGPVSRFGRKPAIHDANHRATYNISLAQPVASSDSIFSTFEGEMKQLVPVGLYSDHSYGRSLACFAATLGPIAWSVASNRIEQALPQGFKFGRGWVGEYEPLPTPVLMLRNCSVKEPAFFAKIEHAPDPGKVEKAYKISISSKENPRVPILENSFPFVSAAGIKQTAAAPTTVSPPVKEPLMGNNSEVKPSFLLSPETKSGNSSSLSYQHQNSQSRNYVEFEKKVLKQVELNGPPLSTAADFIAQRQISNISQMETSRSVDSASKNKNLLTSGSFKQLNTNGLANGKVMGNCLNSDTVSSNMTKAAVYYPHGQGQGVSDPVLVMRRSDGKTQSQQKISERSPANEHQVPSPGPSSSRDDSTDAAQDAARVWMSVGTGGFRASGKSTNLHNKNISTDSLYNPTHDLQPQGSRFPGEFPVSGMHFQTDKSYPLGALVPHGPQPMRVGTETHFQNQPMGFPQLVNADLSRLQLQSTWQNLNPQMRSRQKSFPPDLNIGFQSLGSPVSPASGALVDSQQPDLALQL